MMRVVYVIGTYPLLTTTFVDSEITVLRRWGMDVRVLAVRRPAPGVPLSGDQRALARTVTYLLPVTPARLLASHLYFLAGRPLRYARTLSYLLTRPHPCLRARVRTLLHFGEAVHAAYLVRERDFHELHAHFADRAATIALVVADLLGKPYSLSVHAGADVFVQPVLLREKVARARHVVTCTRRNAEAVAAIAGRDVAGKITPVHHGVDVPRAPRTPPGGPPVILSVAQLKERKGLAVLVEACALLRDDRAPFRCRIVGDGPQRGELERLVAARSLGGLVTLCGPLGHDRVAAEYARATVFALPCVRASDGDTDGIPNVIAEAMALGVPVVSTRLPAIRELVTDARDGLLVAPGDARALAGALRTLLARPALRAELGEAARGTIARTFELEASVERFARTLWPGWSPPLRANDRGVR
jgi:glycosyltransferase involved in cell wall biosynthesis